MKWSSPVKRGPNTMRHAITPEGGAYTIRGHRGAYVVEWRRSPGGRSEQLARVATVVQGKRIVSRHYRSVVPQGRRVGYAGPGRGRWLAPYCKVGSLGGARAVTGRRALSPAQRRKLISRIWNKKHPDFRSERGAPKAVTAGSRKGTVLVYLDTAPDDELILLDETGALYPRRGGRGSGRRSAQRPDPTKDGEAYIDWLYSQRSMQLNDLALEARRMTDTARRLNASNVPQAARNNYNRAARELQRFIDYQSGWNTLDGPDEPFPVPYARRRG